MLWLALRAGQQRWAPPTSRDRRGDCSGRDGLAGEYIIAEQLEAIGGRAGCRSEKRKLRAGIEIDPYGLRNGNRSATKTVETTSMVENRRIVGDGIAFVKELHQTEGKSG